MKHLHLLALTIQPSELDAASADAPNGIVHAVVSVNFRAEDGTVYNHPTPPEDVPVRDAAIGAMARDLFTAVAARLAASGGLPVRTRVDPDAPLTTPAAQPLSVVR